MKATEQLRQWVKQSNRIVFFGGAGVSTESNIPDFRSQDGLYKQKYPYPPEMILSYSFFMLHPDIFYQFYRDKMLYLSAQPNQAHVQLAKWEEEGKLLGVITQNIDGLHQKAGSKNVIELHGSVWRNHCMQCRRPYRVNFILEAEGVPKCTACGGLIKPDVVLYEESLRTEDLQKAGELIGKAEVLLVGGTSLAVYPAAGLLQQYTGDHLVLINQGETPLDHKANLRIHGKIGEVLAQVGA